MHLLVYKYARIENAATEKAIAPSNNLAEKQKASVHIRDVTHEA
jgi:hypothetical protein